MVRLSPALVRPYTRADDCLSGPWQRPSDPRSADPVAVVNAEFNWWLLVVGLVVGAGATWLVLADLRRHEDEVEAAEIEPEATWIAARLAAAARPLSVEAVAAVLRAHRDYLRLGPGELDAILEREEGPDETTSDEPAADRGRAIGAPAAGSRGGDAAGESEPPAGSPGGPGRQATGDGQERGTRPT